MRFLRLIAPQLSQIHKTLNPRSRPYLPPRFAAAYSTEAEPEKKPAPPAEDMSEELAKLRAMDMEELKDLVMDRLGMKNRTAFDVKLESYDLPNKIKAIEEVKALTGGSFQEARELVEDVPSMLKEGVPKEQAELFVARMKEIGAVASME